MAITPLLPSQFNDEATAVTASDWCIVQVAGEKKLRKFRPGVLPDNAVATLAIANQAVTLAKIQNLSAYRLIGRNSASAGAPAQIPCTSFAFSLLDDADAATARATLGAAATAGDLLQAFSAAQFNVPNNSGFRGPYTDGAYQGQVQFQSGNVFFNGKEYVSYVNLTQSAYIPLYALSLDFKGNQANRITGMGGTPAALGTASAGSSSTAARSDHVHAKPSPADIGAATATHNHDTTYVPKTWVDLGVTYGQLNLKNDVGIHVRTADTTAYADIECGDITLDAYVIRSDPRIKRDIVPPPTAAPSAQQLAATVIQYNYRSDATERRKRLGFNAKTLAEVAPSAAVTLAVIPGIERERGLEAVQGIDMMALTAIMVQQIAALEEQVTSLAKRLKDAGNPA